MINRQIGNRYTDDGLIVYIEYTMEWRHARMYRYIEGTEGVGGWADRQITDQISSYKTGR